MQRTLFCSRHAVRCQASFLTITNGPSVQVALRILRPQYAQTQLPIIVYIHGAGWVLGSPQTQLPLRPTWCAMREKPYVAEDVQEERRHMS